MSIANLIETIQDKYLVAFCKKAFQLKVLRYFKFFLLVVILLLLCWLVFDFVRTNFQINNRTSIVENNINRLLSQSSEGGNQAKLNLDIKKIADINLFGELRSTKPVEAVKAVESTSSNLEFSLIGTYLGLGEDLAIILSKKDKQQDVFAPQQKIFDQALLLEVHSDHILVNHLGNKKKIFIEEENSPSKSTSSSDSSGTKKTINVDGAKVEEALNNLPLLLTQARAVPYFKNGKSVGLRLFAIKKGSLFDDIELKNGDILKDINGKSLADITQAVKLFEELKTKKAVSLNLERGKKTFTHDYQIN